MTAKSYKFLSFFSLYGRNPGRSVHSWKFYSLPHSPRPPYTDAQSNKRLFGRNSDLYVEEQMSDELPDFSNVQSGSSSTAPAEKIYEVKSGDSLSKIAKQEYGNANEWNRIFEANKDILKDPNKIFPGQKLKIPAK